MASLENDLHCRFTEFPSALRMLCKLHLRPRKLHWAQAGQDKGAQEQRKRMEEQRWIQHVAVLVSVLAVLVRLRRLRYTNKIQHVSLYRSRFYVSLHAFATVLASLRISQNPEIGPARVTVSNSRSVEFCSCLNFFSSAWDNSPRQPISPSVLDEAGGLFALLCVF